MNKIAFIILLFLSAGSTYAAGGIGPDACKEKAGASQKDYKCGQCEEKLIKKFDTFLENAEKNQAPKSSNQSKEPGINSMEELMATLPEEMRENVVFMGQSRSLQRGERYLMKSPGSEIVASFNGHPDSVGGNSVEIMKFNGKTGTFDFIDITMKNGKPKVTKNPGKCIQCHGEGSRARPIFDPYRFWLNMVPSSGDTVTGGTTEQKDFLELLEKIENKDKKKEFERFAHLKPFLKLNPPDQVRAALAKKPGYWHVKNAKKIPGSTSSSTDGPGVRLFDEMYLNNHCRINNLLSEDPNFETIQYIAAASTRGCFKSEKSLTDFVPPKVAEKMKKYFVDKGILKDPKADVFKAVDADVAKKQKDYFHDRVGRKLWMLEERFRKEDPSLSEKEAYQKAKKEIQKIDKIAGSNPNGVNTIDDKEESRRLISPMRTIMEPLGFNMSDISISFDPGSYTFGDFIDNMKSFEPLFSLTKLSCSDLAKKSIDEFAAKENEILDKIETNCSSIEPYDVQLGELEDIAKDANEKALEAKRKALRPKMEDILSDYSCTMCHKAKNTRGAPNLPLSVKKMDQFDDLMNKSAGELGDMRKRLWSRINRPENNHGAMPPGDPLTREEKETVKAYLETFKGSGRSEADKLKLNESSRRSIIHD